MVTGDRTVDVLRRPRAMSMLPALWRTSVLHAIGGAPGRESMELDAVTVHALRRNAKLVRALVRLAPDSLDVLAADTTRAVDGLRRALGDLRDDAVRRETFDRLAQHAALSADDFAPLLDASRTHAGTAVLPAGVARDLASLGRSWARCDLGRLRDADMVDALVRSYRRGRHRAKPGRSGDTHASHRWRRTIVDLHLQIGVFAGGSSRLRKAARRLGGLRELLGQIHDLDALLTHANALGTLTEGPRSDLARVGAAERIRLMAEIGCRADGVFEMNPKDWADDLAGALHASLRAIEAGTLRSVIRV